MRKRIIPIYISMAVLGISIIVASCDDDILDKKPLNVISEQDIFNDDVLLTDYVNGLYRSFRTFYFGAFYTEGISDNAFINDFASYNRGEVTADNGENITQNAWAENYRNIKDLNIFFDRVKSSTASADVVKRLTAESRFIRAWLYFDLVNWYGGVPLITDVFELGQSSFDVERNTYDEIVGFILDELDLAIAVLPSEDFGENNGRATKGAAMGLKSRVLLYAASALNNPTNDQQKWIAARDAAKAVLDLPEYEMEDNYESLFEEAVSKEIIYARRFTDQNPQITVFQGWNFGSTRYYLPLGFQSAEGTRLLPLQDLVDAYELTDGKLPAESPLFDPGNPYGNRDPRFYATIIYHGASLLGETVEYHVDQNDPANGDLAGKSSNQNGGSASNYNIIKQADINKAGVFGPDPHLIPWIYMRKAEFYLNYAEALIELGQDLEAGAAINAVRSRPGVNLPAVTESGSALLTRYRNERRIELAFENHRWYDIIRWGIAQNKLNQPGIGVRVVRDASTNPPTDTYFYDKVVDNTRKWTENMNYLPIPREEVQRSNESLTQNPGYN